MCQAVPHPLVKHRGHIHSLSVDIQARDAADFCAHFKASW